MTLPKEAVLQLGLGQMGSVLAGRLIAAGYEIRGVDPVGEYDLLPFIVHQSVAEIDDKQRFDIILACLPSPAEVHAAIEWVCSLASDRLPAFFVNVSTIGPDASVDASATLARLGNCTYVEAPISGGVIKAREGQVAILFGVDGDPDVSPVEDMLGHLARVIIKCPSVATASKLKLLNNFVAISNVFGTVEAMRMGAVLGIDPLETLKVLKEGTAGSYVVESTVNRPVTTGDLHTGFALRLALKDMLLLKQAMPDETFKQLDDVILRLEEGMGAGLADHVFPMVALRHLRWSPLP